MKRKRQTHAGVYNINLATLDNIDFTKYYIPLIQAMLKTRPDYWFGNGFCYMFAHALQRLIPGSQLMIKCKMNDKYRYTLDHFFVKYVPNVCFDVNGLMDFESEAFKDFMTTGHIFEATTEFMNEHFPHYRQKEFKKVMLAAARVAKHHIRHNKQKYYSPVHIRAYNVALKAIEKAQQSSMLTMLPPEAALTRLAGTSFIDEKGYVWTCGSNEDADRALRLAKQLNAVNGSLSYMKLTKNIKDQYDKHKNG